MEEVFHDLRLEEEFDHPDCRGWMNLFLRWWWSRMFRFTWAVSVSTYSARFQTFCERHLGFSSGSVVLGRDESRDILALDPELLADEDYKKEFWDRNESRFGLNYFERDLVTSFIRQQPVLCQLIPLCLEVRHDPLEDNASFRFNFGFAVLRQASSDSDPSEKALIYYRVQSHLRKMGLGRRGLLALFSKYPSLELEEAELPAEEDELRTMHSLQRFRQLFFSAQKELRQ